MADAVIGLELHVRLKTRTKLFCGCAAGAETADNAATCPVCRGEPGSLPVLNAEAVRRALVLAAACGGTVSSASRFVRKQYLYPDLPRNYQITQQEEPLVRGGELEFGPFDRPRRIRIERMHLEEDAGRCRHLAEGRTAVDLNRAGAPLLEVVTRPDLTSGGEAYAVLRSLRRLLRWLDVSDARMEAGDLRCDANISLSGGGPRVELKNLNSARGVARALEYEAQRLRSFAVAGESLPSQTRGWDPSAARTYPLRAKESRPEYRFLEEPDLPVLRLVAEAAALAGRVLPELPGPRTRRLARDHRLGVDICGALTADRGAADRFESIARYCDAGAAARWCAGPVAALIKSRGEEAVPGPVRLARLIRLETSGRLSGAQARELLPRLTEDPRDPEAVAAAAGMAPPLGVDHLRAAAAEIVAEHPDQTTAYREGRTRLLGWFVGRLLERVEGRADPRKARALLAEILDV